MRVPRSQDAVVPEEKVTDYLLNELHPAGRGKARFFQSFGFAVADWADLAKALAHHVSDCEAVMVEITPYGRRYVVEGPLVTPDDRNPNLRSVWFVEKDGEPPRLVTAYPCRMEAQ
ncbi:MAG: DUF6883 domain-containing protein [Armatimonadia bacterium]